MFYAVARLRRRGGGQRNNAGSAPDLLRNRNKRKRRKTDVRRRDRDIRNQSSVLSSAVRTASSTLKLVLLDYHNGIEDLSTRTLCYPTPNSATLSETWSTVISTPYDETLASSIGLLPPPESPTLSTSLSGRYGCTPCRTGCHAVVVPAGPDLTVPGGTSTNASTATWVRP